MKKNLVKEEYSVIYSYKNNEGYWRKSSCSIFIKTPYNLEKNNHDGAANMAEDYIKSFGIQEYEILCVKYC